MRNGSWPLFHLFASAWIKKRFGKVTALQALPLYDEGGSAALAALVVLTLCISEVSCRSVGEAVALRVSVPRTGELRLT